MNKKLMEGQEEEFLKWLETTNVRGRMLFDLEGNMLTDLTALNDADRRLIKVIENSEKERYVVSYLPSESTHVLQKLKDDGSLEHAKTLSVDVDEESDILFFSNGNLLVANMGEIFLADSNGSLISSLLVLREEMMIQARGAR